jgi:hypothetical protein
MIETSTNEKAHAPWDRRDGLAYIWPKYLVHGDEITTAQALDWALPRHRRERWRRRDRWSVIVALRAIADPIRKVPPHGAWLWRLRNGEPE